MKDKILLISQNYVKEITSISDNVNDKQLFVAIQEAQNVSLRNVMGSALLRKLKELIADETIYLDENCDYQDLLDECQYFLAYTAVTKLIPQMQFKVDNAGVVLTDDEHMRNLDVQETFLVTDYYQKRADYYCMLLQKYLLRHKAKFPELDECCCNEIRSNLHSAYTSNLFLGGRRGKLRA